MRCSSSRCKGENRQTQGKAVVLSLIGGSFVVDGVSWQRLRKAILEL